MQRDGKVRYDGTRLVNSEEGVSIWVPESQSGLRRLYRYGSGRLNAWDDALLDSDGSGRVQVLQDPKGRVENLEDVVSRLQAERDAEIAEINAMVNKGKIEDAREALKNYEKHADNVEKDINPEKRDDARRSAAAVKQTLKEIESKVSGSEKKEFVDNIIEKERSIVTAVEIADKIKNLCEQLSKLDPSSYYETCNSGDDSPKWQKKLDRKLTEEQREESKNFGRIMEQCFETSGRDCKCEEIPFPDFADACSKAAPLATKCDEGDENACDELDSLEMLELPPHLQDIMDELDGDVSESKYGLHMPPECQKAGAKTPKDCSKIMIETHAPPECKEALLKAGVESESEGRKICDKIMMEKYAPECAEKGITNQDKCQDYMYGIGNRPEECQENQIHDVRDCRRFLEEGGRGKSMNPGKNCKSIENPEERLKCYDRIISGETFEGEGGNFEERFRDVKDKEKIQQVATISANNDENIGKLIADAMEKVGNDGVITVEDGKSTETECEVVEGMQFDRGFISPYMATDQEKMISEQEDPYILITNKKLSSMKELVPILEMVAREGKPLFIIAEDVDGEAQTAIILNIIRGALKVCAVKAPGFGDEQKEILEDIATLTGGKVVSEDKGMKLEHFSADWLGNARKIKVDNEKTIIVEGKGGKKTLETRKHLIESQIKLADTEYKKTDLKKRLAKLGGGVAVIRVGAVTETEMKEKKMRIDDALNATKAAVEEGVIAGGGVTLLKAISILNELKLENDQQIGINIVRRALEEPIRQIAKNAGKEGADVLSYLKYETNENVGYNAKKDIYEDLFKAGVIDPTKVVRNALQNSASISAMILTTEALITNFDEEKDEKSATIII